MRSTAPAAALFILLALLASPVSAEVTASSPGAFLVRGEAQLTSPPDRVWRSLTRLDRWWNPEHTYSGDARNLRLDVRAGGCWCERWGQGQSVEHARVLLVMERDGVRTLRLAGGLGPLQEMGAPGVLTVTVSPDDRGSRLEMTYRVAGETGLGLEALAPLVDQVLMEQMGRLVRYTETGAPQ